MATRGYQYDFSLQHREVFDIESRTLKATTALAVLRYVLGAAIEQATLLNVGASSGAMDAVFAESFQRVFGIDIDSHAIDHAQRTFVRENLTFQVGDALDIPFEDASMDVVVCSQIHEHVQDQDKLFDEIRRVLRPNGVCYFAATNRWVLMEPHYRMLFLSWLPRRFADVYLRIRGRGDQYYERMVGLRELRRLTSKFSVTDFTCRMLADPAAYAIEYMVRPGSIKQRVSLVMAKLLPSLSPGYIWILQKSA